MKISFWLILVTIEELLCTNYCTCDCDINFIWNKISKTRIKLAISVCKIAKKIMLPHLHYCLNWFWVSYCRVSINIIQWNKLSVPASPFKDIFLSFCLLFINSFTHTRVWPLSFCLLFSNSFSHTEVWPLSVSFCLLFSNSFSHTVVWPLSFCLLFSNSFTHTGVWSLSVDAG